MGIFSQLERSWLTVGHQLFIWDYKDGSDFYEYEDQDEIITNVGIAQAKSNTFDDNVKHVLVVTTASRIVIYGVSVDTSPESDQNGRRTKFTLHEKKGLSVVSDQTHMSNITGSKNGRIFMIGSDNHLYELEYQKDNSRQSNVYTSTLTCRTSHTMVRYLPTVLSSFLTIAPEVGIKYIAVDHHWDFLYILTEDSAIEVIYLGDPQNAFISLSKNTDIVSAASLKCSQLHRLTDFALQTLHVIPRSESRDINLFAVTSTGLRLYFNCHANELKLVHVRLPPPVGNSWFETPRKMHMSYYNNGVFLTAERKHKTSDTVLITSQEFNKEKDDEGKSKISSAESSSIIDSDGKVWVISEISTQRPMGNHLHEIAERPTKLPRQFMVMTDSGFTIFNKQRPIDMLYKILQQSYKDPMEYTKSLNSFLERYGEIETSAMCLAHICTAVSSGSEKEPVVNAGIQLYLNCNQPVDKNSMGSSEKHGGLTLYLSRCLEPLWEAKIFSTKNNTQPTQDLLRSTQLDLLCLKKFIDTTLHQKEIGSDNALALKLSDDSYLEELYRLIVHSSEVISFLEFVIGKGVPESLPATTKNALTDLTLMHMLTTSRGFDLAKTLVQAAIESNTTSHHHEVGAVSEFLRSKCNTYFGAVDMAYFKVTKKSYIYSTADTLMQGVECMRAAYKVTEQFSKVATLSLSVMAFKDIASHLTENDISNICNEYCSLAYHSGALELAFECVARQEPCEGTPISTRRTMDGKSVYTHVFTTLKDAYDRRSSGATAYDTGVFSNVLSYQDEAFHHALYSWYIQNDMIDVLLEVESSYVISYLEHYKPKAEGLDYLWQYYQQRARHYDAALCLETLATQLPGIKLKKRMEYLLLAISQARYCNTESQREQEALDLAEKLIKIKELAALQIRIQENLDVKDMKAKTASVQLEAGFLHAEELLDTFAYQFNMCDEALLLIKMLHRQDWRFVQKIWTGLIKKNEELSTDESSSFTQLREKVISLGQLLYPSTAAFPVYLVAQVLHTHCLQHNREKFTQDVLESIGVPDDVIADAFSCLN
ncbi:hypothetical protein DFQ28_009075 [Apophysomyces sp. BC1034]|nr:hypothetical protein DFQ28_009075 [Apophysomyces sp. BC1034]